MALHFTLFTEVDSISVSGTSNPSYSRQRIPCVAQCVYEYKKSIFDKMEIKSGHIIVLLQWRIQKKNVSDLKNTEENPRKMTTMHFKI